MRAIRSVFRVESLAWELEKAVHVPLSISSRRAFDRYFDDGNSFTRWQFSSDVRSDRCLPGLGGVCPATGDRGTGHASAIYGCENVSQQPGRVADRSNHGRSGSNHVAASNSPKTDLH